MAVCRDLYSVVVCIRQMPLLASLPRGGAPGGSCLSTIEPVLMTRSRTRQAHAIIVSAAALLAVVLTTVGSANADPTIQSKRAQAQDVLAQIHQSDAQLERAIEAYNYANVELAGIDADLSSNARHLVIAQKSLGAAQTHIADRLRALYVNGDGGGAVEILLGAQNLDDLLSRLDMVQRVGDQDAKVLGDVKQFRKEVKQRAGTPDGRARRAGQGRGRAGQPEAGRSRPSSQSVSGCSRGSRARSSSSRPRRRARQARLAAQARARLEAQQRAQTRRAGSGGRNRRRRLRVCDHERPAPPTRSDSRAAARRHRLRSTEASSASRCSTSAPPTSGAARAREASTARASSPTSTPRWASRCRTTPPPSTATARRSRTTTSQPGDLVFFSGLGHVGIYIGGGQFIHAPHTGDVVKISSLSGARRLRRRPPALGARSWRQASRPRSYSASTASAKFSHDDAALQLQRRRHLVVLHREVARQDREALDLLEARALAVDAVDDALHERVDARVACERRDVAVDPVRRRPLPDLGLRRA